MRFIAFTVKKGDANIFDGLMRIMFIHTFDGCCCIFIPITGVALSLHHIKSIFHNLARHLMVSFSITIKYARRISKSILEQIKIHSIDWNILYRWQNICQYFASGNKPKIAKNDKIYAFTVCEYDQNIEMFYICM